MKNSKMWLFAIVITLLSILTACGQDDESSTDEGNSNESAETTDLEGVPEALQSGEQLEIMVIRKIGGDDHTQQFLAGTQQEGQALGMKVDTFSANGDTTSFHDTISQAINQEYDGLIISHGDDDTTVELIQEARDKGIEVVAFDTNEGALEIDGVTLTSQNDEELATLALDKLVEEHPEANIGYLWVDGFPPMVRRNNVYETVLEENPGIKEVKRFGDATDPQTKTQEAVGAWLTELPEGEIDAIFATWDAFAVGATRAIQEAGREEIDVYGIDVSNADLQLMQEENSPWKYTAAVDPKLIGAVNVRLLAKKFAGEETPQEASLEPSMISQEELNASDEEVNMETLADVVEGWGESDQFKEDWMATLKEHHSN
ncbi:monosaccharide ABC transporter substrate-binding protein, CUT2 family [Gracilibacillus kekensis]|uniref:Monosaccharide ABC transporter substrate-binding protein, CUT2 family n=2 Tax=Gracilibacillus kekensis TaxID=1027249 RepID=A0A1M7QW66_9BACI|nr:sugar ABC transporter substrate-binding protein [Gracilibacillus kekensis]SHN35883.1 monosaccharide ABC transporter substrate-binding protein, CUT2 family [Gracilibacillus kekensis]